MAGTYFNNKFEYNYHNSITMLRVVAGLRSQGVGEIPEGLSGSGSALLSGVDRAQLSTHR